MAGRAARTTRHRRVSTTIWGVPTGVGSSLSSEHLRNRRATARERVAAPCCLERFVRRAGDDLVLELCAEIAEVVAMAGDAHDQVAVSLGVGLRLAQCAGIDDVELDMVAAHGEVGPHQLDEAVQPGIICQQPGRELLAEQCAAGACVSSFARCQTKCA